MAARLVCKVEALQQAPYHWQQARLLHIIMQQPAGLVTIIACLVAWHASLSSTGSLGALGESSDLHSHAISVKKCERRYVQLVESSGAAYIQWGQQVKCMVLGSTFHFRTV